MHRPLNVNKQWDSLKQTAAWALQPPKESREQIDLRGARQETPSLVLSTKPSGLESSFRECQLLHEAFSGSS